MFFEAQLITEVHDTVSEVCVIGEMEACIGTQLYPCIVSLSPLKLCPQTWSVLPLFP